MTCFASGNGETNMACFTRRAYKTYCTLQLQLHLVRLPPALCAPSPACLPQLYRQVDWRNHYFASGIGESAMCRVPAMFRQSSWRNVFKKKSPLKFLSKETHFEN